MMMKKRIIYLLIGLGLSGLSYAQDDLLNELEEEEKDTSFPVIATFKTTRLINMSTIEVEGKGTLEFRIAHRFNDVAGSNGGASTLFGLDGPVALQLYFNYSLTDRLAIGFGRTNYNKLLDGNIKYRLLRQTTDDRIPVSITVQTRANLTHEKNDTFSKRYDNFAHRLSYVNQIMVARKFGKRFSLQLNGYHLHYNLVKSEKDKNDVFAAGAIGRFKINNRFALTGEYGGAFGNYVINRENFVPSGSLGVDIETGGHVFQLFFTNSFLINEAQFLPFTTRRWSEGQFRWGFNVSRVF